MKSTQILIGSLLILVLSALPGYALSAPKVTGETVVRELIEHLGGTGEHEGVASNGDRCRVTTEMTKENGEDALFMRIEGKSSATQEWWSTYLVIRTRAKARDATKLWSGCDRVIQLDDMVQTGRWTYHEESLICMKTTQGARTVATKVVPKASFAFDCSVH